MGRRRSVHILLGWIIRGKVSQWTNWVRKWCWGRSNHVSIHRHISKPYIQSERIWMSFVLSKNFNFISLGPVFDESFIQIFGEGKTINSLWRWWHNCQHQLFDGCKFNFLNYFLIYLPIFLLIVLFNFFQFLLQSCSLRCQSFEISEKKLYTSININEFCKEKQN